jgi:hypothetical protein
LQKEQLFPACRTVAEQAKAVFFRVVYHEEIIPCCRGITKKELTMLFDHLDEFTKTLIRDLSPYVFYDLSLGGTAAYKYPLLKEIENDSRFWADFSEWHYDTRPYEQDEQDVSKQWFQGEYLFKSKRYQEAAEKGNFHAIYKFVNDNLNENTFDQALHWAVEAERKFGMVGTILYLQVCQFAVQRLIPEKDDYAKLGLNCLKTKEGQQVDERSQYFLDLFDWTDTIKNNYGSVDQFFAKGINFFTLTANETTSCIMRGR